MTSGPIPSPEALANYNEIVPGLAQTIVENWLDESHHRRSEQSSARMQNYRIQSRGQIFAFILTLLFFGGSMTLIYQGHGASGISLIIAQIAALAGVFIFGKMKSPKTDTARDRAKDQKDRSESN
ncbi:MAG: DUF2335 domain-containing protein [bacterium]|nr:DUF2335 domain-containing protein [bacterium]